MATQISDELRLAIEMQGDRPLELIDPQTNKVYFVVPREQYERLKPLFENDPLSRKEQEELLRRAGNRAGWDEPEMDAYDRYDNHRAEQS
ncbi:MAG: hypothetical protein WD648_11835 [Planctomycetaceae bacterium]